MRPGRKKRQSVEDVVCKPSNPCEQLERISHGFTPQWCHSTLSSTHLLFPPKRGDLSSRSHHPLVRAAPWFISWHFCLLHACKIPKEKPPQWERDTEIGKSEGTIHCPKDSREVRDKYSWVYWMLHLAYKRPQIQIPAPEKKLQKW